MAIATHWSFRSTASGRVCLLWGVFATTGVVQLSLGAFLALHGGGSNPDVFFRSALTGAVLLAIGLAQLGFALLAHHDRRTFHEWRCYARWTISGLVLCYTASLVMDKPRAAPYVFVSSFSVWHFVAQLTILWRLSWLQRHLTRTVVRRIGWAGYGVLMSLLCAELGLRTFALLTGDRCWARCVVGPIKFLPGDHVQGQATNATGYWDDEFTRDVRPGIFRIAALGDELMLAGCPETNFLQQIERSLARVEIYNFGVPQAGPREYLAQLEVDVLPYEPDLVLVFLNVAAAAIEPPPGFGIFDPRNLHLVQRTRALSSSAHLGHGAERFAAARSLESNTYLSRCAGSLRVCQTPVSGSSRQYWARLYRQLDALLDRCRSSGTRAALVIVPSEFQVDRQVCTALCRRTGFTTAQLDLELPQRRLLTYAQDHEVPCIDLLPHLRACHQPTFCCNDRLFNEHGNVVAARVVGNWLASQYRTAMLAQSD